MNSIFIISYVVDRITSSALWIFWIINFIIFIIIETKRLKIMSRLKEIYNNINELILSKKGMNKLQDVLKKKYDNTNNIEYELNKEDKEINEIKRGFEKSIGEANDTKNGVLELIVKNILSKWQLTQMLKSKITSLLFGILAILIICVVIASLMFFSSPAVSDLFKLFVNWSTETKLANMLNVLNVDNYIIIVYSLNIIYYIISFKLYSFIKIATNKYIYKISKVLFVLQIFSFSTSRIMKCTYNLNEGRAFTTTLAISIINVSLLIYYFIKYISKFKYKKLISFLGFTLIIITDMYILFQFGLCKLSMNSVDLENMKNLDIVECLMRTIYFGASGVFSFPKIGINESLIPFALYILWYFFSLIIIGVLVAYFREFIKPQTKVINELKCISEKTLILAI